MQLEREYFTPLFEKWLARRTEYLFSGIIELKISLTNVFYLRNIAKHQIRCTNLATKRFIWKAPDFGGQTPGDIIYICDGVSYFGIMFYAHQKQTKFIMIDAVNMKGLYDNKELNHITEEHAKTIGFECDLAD